MRETGFYQSIFKKNILKLKSKALGLCVLFGISILIPFAYSKEKLANSNLLFATNNSSDDHLEKNDDLILHDLAGTSSSSAMVAACTPPDYNGDLTLKSSITISSSFGLQGGNFPASLDGNATANAWWVQRFQNITNQTVLQFQFPEATILTGIEHTGGNGFLRDGAEYIIQGSNDESSWIDVTGVQAFSGSLAAPQYGAPQNTMQFPIAGNTTAYVYYRIFGVSFETWWDWVDEFYFEVQPGNKSDLSNMNCGNNGTPLDPSDDFISFDLDPCGGGDGNMYTISASSGTINPSSGVFGTPSSFALSNVPAGGGNINLTISGFDNGNDVIEMIASSLYIDSDGDAVCNIFDFDDDNDGVLDHTESPNCFYTLSDFPYESGDRTSSINVSTEWTVNNGDLTNILNGNTADNAVRKSNGDFTFTGEEFLHFTLPQALTFDEIIIYHEGAVFLDEQLVGIVQGSNDNASWTDLTVSGTVLPDGASPHTITLNQNLADYLYYRIYVTSGRIDDDEYLREVEFSMLFNPSKYPKPTCADDFDGDMILNHLDLDSDGDLCSDALEAGATLDLTADFQFPSGGSGANGVPDMVEDGAESGVINYISTYPDANSTIVKSCFDSDGDSVIDLFDMDDDNDGILDATEKSAPCPGDGVLNWTSYTFPSNLGNTSQLPGNTISGSGTSPTIDLVGMSGTRFGLIFTGYIIIAENGSHAFTLISDDGSSLHIDGDELINITGGSSSSNVVLTAGPHLIEIRYYENTGGENLSLTYQPPSEASAISIPSLFLSSTYPSCDEDGIPNHLDLDSDGDGIPDNIEAQATAAYVPPNPDSPGTYAGNDGVNTAYIGGLPLPDTDIDNIADFLDIESDNDQILDVDESGLSLTGMVGMNGLDSGVETSDDYQDVNGVVNDPNTDLAKVTTTTAEADYRDKNPPTIVKVCYNSDAYSISGSQLTWADEKLLNTNNWGENGVDKKYQFDLFSFGTGAITEAALLANGCQIFYAGGNNSAAGSFDPNNTSALSTADKEALKNWGESPNNVIITFQGLAAFMGGPDYAGDNNNSNPNALTDLGDVVISGLFGQPSSFNQGGSWQGRFTAFPSSACVITVDNNDNPTGLLNGVTGDFYFADYDLLSELGGLSNNDGIVSNTDMFFANLFSSAAMVAIEGPENACNAFLCPAGDDAPSLTSMDVSSAGLPVDLNTLFAGIPPDGAILTWHNATPVADENYIGNSASYTDSGIVYAAFRSEDGSCYSPSTPVMVMVNYPDLEVTVSPGTETSASGEIQSFVVTVINNGTITAPDAVVKVPIPIERKLILANPSAGSYSGSTYLWNVGELVNGQSETLDITIKL